jgi:hypothetical protein
MIYGTLEYDAETHCLYVYVNGNSWVKKDAAGVDDIPELNVADEAARTEFLRAAAPGGAGIQKYGFEPVRISLPITSQES